MIKNCLDWLIKDFKDFISLNAGESLFHCTGPLYLNQGCGSGGSGPFSVEAEARKFHRFRFHIRGKKRGRKEIGSAILRRKANIGSINIKKLERL